MDIDEKGYLIKVMITAENSVQEASNCIDREEFQSSMYHIQEAIAILSEAYARLKKEC